MALGFDVPAEYFYALTANLPIDVGVEDRYQLVVTTDPQHNVDALRAAIQNGVIGPTGLAITPEQAGRRLAALGSANGSGPVCTPGLGAALLSAAGPPPGWLAYVDPTPSDDPDVDIEPFWASVLAPLNSLALTNAGLAGGHLLLALAALNQQSDPTAFLTAVNTVGATLPSLSPPLAAVSVKSVKDIDPTPFVGTSGPTGISFDQWFAIFSAQPSIVPAFATVGTKPITPGMPTAEVNKILTEQTNAFVRRVAQFFNVPVAPGTSPSAPGAGLLPMLPQPSGVEPFAAFAGFYGAGFADGTAATLIATTASTAAGNVFPGDARAQAWLVEAAGAINALFYVTNLTPPLTPVLRFSLVEALYARGFTAVAQIAALPADIFVDALVGSPAYDYAPLLYARALGTATPPQDPTPPQPPFGPINDGTLANCVPPPWLSPLGPVEYLRELWLLPETATCELPAGDPKSPTLGSVVGTRRGPLGDQLLATKANLEVALPMIDLVNECLETLVADGTVDIVNQTTDGVADAAKVFAAAPEHSTPVAGLAGAYSKLKGDFSAPVLPYSQAIDVSRSYLQELGTSRFVAMRRFRKDIAEFVLDPDPTHTPTDFATYRWRYPVRIEVAREYLGITPEEYSQLFAAASISPAFLAQLYGFSSSAPATWMQTVCILSEFLARTGLTYCEFRELWSSQFVSFGNRAPGREGVGEFPPCEPCYGDKQVIVFQVPVAQALTQLAVFIRLWRKLREVRGARYSFTHLADIVNVLQLFTGPTTINPDFVRQLVAFQMLRDDFQLPLVDPHDTTPGTLADRTHLLALFAMPPSLSPVPRKWGWAVERLLDRVAHHAHATHHAKQRPSEFVKLLASNLDPVSQLAGFDPTNPAARWFSHPSCTLRFAEVLSKVYASHFGVGELLWLFTVGDALDGDDPFPLPSAEESNDYPLDLPDESGERSLAALRRKLLELDLDDAAIRAWTWGRIEASLHEDFGVSVPAGAPDPVTVLGQHFFPETLERAGTSVDARSRRYGQPLAAASTTPGMWNAPGDGPFHFDPGAGAGELWANIPLRDEAVLEKLSRIRPLSPAEATAVRDLYFAPRVALAPFAFLFRSFDEADRNLVQQSDEGERWAFFQRAFALCHARCRLIARHLAEHVKSGACEPEDEHLAWKLLQRMAADENQPTAGAGWEDDGGPPSLQWAEPAGGAFAALLGLLGTGLLGELRAPGASTPLWRELRGPFAPFDRVRDLWNAPVPTLLPSFDAALPAGEAGLAGVRNGIAVSNTDGRPLGGVEAYTARWTGVLLVDEGGPHEFFTGEDAREQKWKVTLKRGQKTWVVVAHDWPGEDGPSFRSSPLPLKRGAYELTIELERCPPDLHERREPHPLRGGFELEYKGPDTGGEIALLPLHRLFVPSKSGPLVEGMGEQLNGAPKAFLSSLYVSTLRDVRRTYQRAFKAMLLSRRFDLHARPFADYAQSEIGYLLDHGRRFEGLAFTGSVGAWTTHHAWLDFDLLPVRDPYAPPPSDLRANPTEQRQQALFDIWERLFDYTGLRRATEAAGERAPWLLFDEASQNPAEDPAQVLRYLVVNATLASPLLAYDMGYAVATADLQDERWPVRVWKAHEWLRALGRHDALVHPPSVQPALWVADDPAASGGNANLVSVVHDAAVAHAPPRRYDDLKRLNDGLRERARHALVTYLCGPSGVAASPKALAAQVLLDVEVGLRERASRIEEAVTAVQTFVHQARLGLEPSWTPSEAFIRLWTSQYATYRVWLACKRRQMYRENWIEWDELEQARRTEAFRFLESELRRDTLTVPEPGGMTYWQPTRPPLHSGLELLQAREPSEITLLPSQPEALDLLGRPERSGRRSWLASLPGVASPPTPPQPPTQPGNNLPTVRKLAVAPPPPSTGTASGALPWWVEAAIRLGTTFLRVPAAAVPPASNPFSPRRSGGKTSCCKSCGRRHEAVMDEYYFWLVDSRSFSKDDPQAIQDPNANWDDDPGEENGDLPKLLAWPAVAGVYLMWARMHDGELQQPRRSTRSVALQSGATSPPQLVLDGRKGDSIYLAVQGAAVAPPGYASTPTDVGFRYDIATDSAVVVPQVAPDPSATLPAGTPFAAYPYFAYFAPGAPLAPLSPFSESVAVAGALRSHCRFEAALQWYQLTYNPLGTDVRWCWESLPVPAPPTQAPPTQTPPSTAPPTVAAPSVEQAREGDTGLCCRYSTVTPVVARNRAITLDYLETLLEWGDAAMRKDAPEAFQQARVTFDTAAKILGPRPVTILDHVAPPPPTVVALDAAAIGVPLNPRLMALYDRIEDRLVSIRADMNARRLRNGRLHDDMPYWTESEAHERPWRGEHTCCSGCGCREECADEGDWCCLPSPYRFTFLLQKAIDLANDVRSFGTALLSAYEKGDAEYLAYVRASHERQLSELAIAVREDAWRAADWDVQALGDAKQSAQNQLQYYTALVAAGLNTGENNYQDLTNSASGALTAATVSETISTIIGPIPDLFVGEDNFTWLALGTKLAGVFEGIARISSTTAQIMSTNAGLQLTEASWVRRDAEWRHQIDIYTIQIAQIQCQILAAQRRRDSALHDLNNARLQVQQSREIQDVLRDKFTSDALYLYLQRETAALHRQMFDLATRAARQAEKAFNFERGYTSRHFLPCEPWKDLREGLLAGEKLALALRRMDKCYCDENIREYELTKHVSLRQLFPLQFLHLKRTGACEIEIPEWLFDLDYPGQYMRRIKNVSLSIPCVAGPYAGIHCRLTLLSSETRIVPWLLGLEGHCCKDDPPVEPRKATCGCWSELPPRSDEGKRDREPHDDGYAPRLEDPRIVHRYLAKEAIATSSGQNDTGMFEVNFRDERYLPFEFEGAVSRWRVELPHENNYFDMDTLSDVVVHLNYTAREGGDVLRDAARRASDARIPDGGRRIVDVRQELADEWRRFEAQPEDDAHRRLELPIRRDTFPFLPGHRDVWITRIDVFFEEHDAHVGDHRKVAFVLGHEKGCKHERHAEEEAREIECVASAASLGMFHGAVDVEIGPLEAGDRARRRGLGALRFDRRVGAVGRLFIVFSYEARERRGNHERELTERSSSHRSLQPEVGRV